MKKPIYMDNHATTRVDPRVLDVMLPYLRDSFGNASSRHHSFGWRAEEAVDIARKQVADLMGATEREIVFTSGATEANNLAIFGVEEAYRSKGQHVITQETEHKAVLDCCKLLESRGCRVTYLPVDEYGLVAPDALREALTDETILVSVMMINNEIGTVQPIADLGEICRSAGVLFHTDAAQALGKVPFDVESLNADLVSVSAHKMYGPKGVGALYVRRRNPRVTLAPQMIGGGHERGFRSGTLNVPGIVGFGAAAKICSDEGPAEGERVEALRERLWKTLSGRITDIHLNGHPVHRHPGSLNVSFGGIEGEALLMALRDVAVSSGAACASATLEPSHVLRAIGVDDDLAQSSIRFGLGRFNTDDEVTYVAEVVVEQVARLKKLNPAGNQSNNRRRVV